MDANATTSSSAASSAAAVADSASAVTNTKTATTTTNNSATAVSATVTATSVKLLIKASNQQFDDHTIESDLQWTVKRLKTQLSLVYPSKPLVSEQKLIYSGQLLNDTLLLKDVIRSYKDVHTQHHIFHLVCASKQLPPATNLAQKPKPTTAAAVNATTSGAASTTDGLRYRNVVAGVQQQQQHQMLPPQQQLHHQQQQQNAMFNSQFIPQMLAANTNPNCPNFNANGAPNMLPFGLPAQFNLQSLATQQAAMYNWMQQVYAQYMEQCLRLSNSAGLANLPAASPAADQSGGQLPPLLAQQYAANAFLLQQQQQLPFNAHAPNFAAFTGLPAAYTLQAATPNPVIQMPSATAVPVAAAAPEQPVAAVAAVAGEQQQQQLVAPPRFPNIAQDEQDNHDWLDSFFSLTRLAIFLTILFFNTSPLRCLIVVIIAGGIYLYHIGVFRRGERNNNNINRNNNAAVVGAAAAIAAARIRQGVQQVQQQQQEQQQQQPPQQQQPEPDAAAAGAAPVATAAETNSGTEEPLLPDVAANAAEEHPTTTVISFIRTFVVSFFTSLLPETPAQ